MSESGPTSRLVRPAGRLEVRADLRLDVDGIDVRISGDGSRVRVETARPVALLRQVRTLGAATPAGPAAIARIADALAENGLTVEAAGPRGTSVLIGADASSRAVGRLVGTPHVQVSGGSGGALAVAAASLGLVVGWLIGRRVGRRRG